MTDLLRVLARKAELRARAGLRRELRPRSAGDTLIDLAGNDYLGLAVHPAVIDAAVQTLRGYGLGATGSRLVRGTTDLHERLEAALADWMGADFALVYSSGYLANLGAIRGLALPGTRIVIDEFAHASLLDGVRLSGMESRTYRHADAADADRILGECSRAGDGRLLLITESVFSVDGDLADLAELHRVARAHRAVLLVDDAHGLGVIGPRGAGGVVGAGIAGEPDVVVTATLSKALGGAGGVIAGASGLRQHLVDTGRTFIFDTALPPATAAGVAAALELARSADGGARRDILAARRSRLTGLFGAVTDGGVFPIPAESAEAALAWANACHERGVAVGCFRPPSTPDHISRLRLTLNAGVSEADFELALQTIQETR
ncbi:8-amino-7-oxononanoate synthase [Allocatelliglobosispora scoriae]|uniref:8-amino-7-oxononanoate synthase n=1 Tax=Allocatelliglobosispora scoriae TaxID=643052 RepID=A0A841C031_9ACTN|nr:8-amino-7-oxononanoate synthase [Allocatelliglobosispora scoriae]MBB5872503.1 8-amino-7-oxononanoate synthase [Allocatelliglobosispora scoriae]